MGMRDIVLSARTTGFVMNYPLYDGGVSEKARRLIAEGRLAAALEEYQRLAATGSAIGKCVLAYLHLRDLPGAPHDVEASKVLATAALSQEPGYANYILSYAAHFENDAKEAIDRMAASYRAHFVPAAGALGLIFAAGYGVAKHPKEAETLFLRGIKSGHIPSTLMLCRFYMRGERGLGKTIFGHLVFPLAWLYLWISARFMIFSIRQFQHFHMSALPMFNEKALKP
jgi:TPR repeat protein